MPSEQDCVEHLLKLTTATKTRKLRLQETVTLGLLVSLKWDRAKSEKAPGYVPTLADLNGHDRFTNTELSDLRETAMALLDQHAEKTISRGQWWSGVGQGLTAALIWSIVIFVIGVVAIKSQGGEIGSLLREFTTEHRASATPPTDGGQPKPP